MKYIYLQFIMLFLSGSLLACDFYNANTSENTNVLMGKKSKFYDVYKQSRCALEETLSKLPKEQRVIIAELIAKAYRSEIN